MEEESTGFNVIALIGLVLAILLFVAILLVVPQFADMFNELGIELPAPTAIALSPMTSYAIGIGLIVLFLIALIIPEHAGRQELTFLAFVFLVCTVGFYVLALYMPMIEG